MGDFTLGVEEEFHVLDAETGALSPNAAAVLAATSGQVAAEAEPELLRSQVEVGTPVCSTVAELRVELHRLRTQLAASAAEVGCLIAASGTWPAATPQMPPTRNDRYEHLVDMFGPTAHRPVCGCHIHVHVEDPDLQVAVIRRVRPWLAPLLALSANSPFWRGADTGYASYRSQVWARWPTAGPPPALRSRADYDHLVSALLATGVLRDKAMLYWEVRASERYPTVEFRVADVCLRVENALLLAALARGLTRMGVAAELAGEPCDDMPAELLRLAHWRAARYGLAGELVDPVTGRPAAAAEVVSGLVRRVRPALEEAGDADFVNDAVRRLTTEPTADARQRAAYRRAGCIEDVVRLLVEETALSV